MKYGDFIQNIFAFTIIAFAVFAMVKVLNNLKKAPEPKVAELAKAPEPTAEEKLLTEIRDVLKNKI